MMGNLKSLAILGFAPILLLGYTSVAGAQGGQGNAPATAGQCKVTVDRNQEAGVLDVTRQEFDDGNCVCLVYTGPQSQPAATEGKVTAISKSRRCPDAGVMAVPPLASAGAGSAGAGSLTGLLLPIGGGAAIGAVILAGDGSPASP